MTAAPSPLDRAILRYREDPTEANRAALLALQQQHNQSFMRTQGASFIRRTTGDRK